MRLCIVSKNKRTEVMFRRGWIEAADEECIKVELVRRSEGMLPLFCKVLCEKFKGNRIGTFGVSESLLMSLIKPDLMLFSGLGRLLDKDSKLRKILFKWLLVTCRHSVVVCLNHDDLRILNAIGFTRVYKINGEGYQRKPAGRKSLLRKGDFLYVGRLLKSKGLTVVLDCFLASRLRDCTLNIVGDRDFGNSDSLSQQEEDSYVRRSSGLIRFHGYQSDLSDYYTSDAIYVSASKREGMPFSVLEALDNQMFCILSKVPGHKDLAKFSKVRLFKDKNELIKAMVSIKNINESDKFFSELNIYSKDSVKTEIKNIYKAVMHE